MRSTPPRDSTQYRCNRDSRRRMWADFFRFACGLLGRQSPCLLGKEVLHDAAHMHPGGVRSDIDQAAFAKFRKSRLLNFNGRPVFIESRRNSSSNLGNMFSMAGAAAFLPFLSMLPIQVLLNNLVYDVSEIAIPFNR